MKLNATKRIATLMLAVCMLASTIAPTASALEDDMAPSTSVVLEPEASAEPETGTELDEPPAQPESPGENATPTPDPEETQGEETPGVEESPIPTPEETPAPTPAPEQAPETVVEPEQEKTLEIIEMTGSIAANVGDVVEFSVGTNAAATYQWQQLYTPPAEEPTEGVALYPYAEGESTDYYYPLEGLTEAELLEINPDAVWAGIEIYYAELAKLQNSSVLTRSARAASVPQIANGTKNYVLEPDADDATAQKASVGTWEAIAGETAAVFAHTVTADDAYTSYRCIVTAAEPATAPEAAAGTEPLDAEAAPTEATAEPQTELVSDSMHVQLPPEAEAAPQAASAFAFSGAALSAADVTLSADKQWLTGVDGSMEYITAETYDAQGGSAANNPYWTKLSGGKRPDGTYYASTLLIDNKTEVLSAWYGRTVYVRSQGDSGKGTSIDIPAYTDMDYQTGQKTLYKKAIKVFNAYVADTGASFYANYLGVALQNGNTPDGGHITVARTTIDSFNRQATSYLTNAEGDYIYDAVIVGAATNDEPDLSGAAAWVLADYINHGYGFLIGHDMIYGYGGVSTNPDYVPDPTSTVTPYYVPNTRTDGHYNMAWLMGQQVYYTHADADPYDAASMILGLGDYTDKSTMYGDDSGYSKLRVVKTSNGNPQASVAARTPANYPYASRWDGTPFAVGVEFQGTATHSNQQLAYGTVWVNYATNTIASIGAGRLVTDKHRSGLTGTNNFYLTTNGNFGMNQIGHTVGNKDIARIDECYMLANTLFYISQRQQCQVCQSQQGGNEEIHLVHRISSAADLAKLADQDKYWFTHPLDGCYMLTADIVLPADWQPIVGFDGHFHADNHNITFADDLPDANRYIFAPSGDGWNLGTDSDNGTTNIHDANGKTTGIARVVGYLSALGLDAAAQDGYRVEVQGTDGKTYSCITNLDGKYVISNLPCTGKMVARVYDPAGNEVTSLGNLRVIVPDGSGIISVEGRTQDFWHSSETTAIFPLDFTAIPVADTMVFEGETAFMLEGGVYWQSKVTDISWQYLPTGSTEWQDIATLDSAYTVTDPVFTAAGDDSYTSTSLTIHAAPQRYDGYHFRAVFKDGSKTTDTYAKRVDSKTGLLEVAPPQIAATISEGQTVNLEYPDEISTETATYTSVITYTPGKISDMSNPGVPDVQWMYNDGTMDERAPWSQAAATALYPGSGIAVTTSQTQPVLVDGTTNTYQITCTMTLTNIPAAMDTGRVHYRFSTAAATNHLLQDVQCNSPSADLTILYGIDIKHNDADIVKYCAPGGYVEYTYPDAAVTAPNGLRTLFVQFASETFDSRNKITYGTLPAGVSAKGNDYGLTFYSTDGSLLPVETWEAVAQALVFTSYDADDAEVFFYVDEDDWSTSTGSNLFYNPQNGHWYEYIRSTTTWTSAKAAAEKRYCAPLDDYGYLVTFTSAEEESFADTLTNGAFYWIGATCETKYTGDGNKANWYWVTGPEAGTHFSTRKSGGANVVDGMYANWNTGEPNNGNGGGEYYAHKFWGGGWNDMFNGGTEYVKPVGYLVEYGHDVQPLSRTNHSATDTDTVTGCSGYQPITVSITAADKVYDGTETNAVVAVTGDAVELTPSQVKTIMDNLQVDYSTGAVTGANATGSGAIDVATYTATVTAPNQAATPGIRNYAITFANGGKAIFEITPRPLTLHSKYLVTDATTADTLSQNVKQYDGTNTANVRNIVIDNVINGDDIGLDKAGFAGTYATAAAGETLNADGSAQADRYIKLAENSITRTEDIALTGAAAGNYYIAVEDYSGAIFRRMITAQVTNATSVYGDDPALNMVTNTNYSASDTGAGSNLTISALVADDTLTLDTSKSDFVLPSVDATSPAGVYDIGYTGLTDANYPVLSNYIVWQQLGNLTITPRPIIISAGNYSMVYGDPLPAFAAVTDGLVNGDTIADATTGEAVFATDASSTADVGSYPIDLTGLVARENANGSCNYIVYLRPGNIDITKRPLIITPDPDNPVKPDVTPDEVKRVEVVKAVDKTTLAVGETATYSVTVTNIGTVELTDLLLHDVMTGAAGSINAADGQGYTYNAATGTFTVARLPVAKSIVITYTYTATAADAGTTLANVAIATIPGSNPEDPANPGKGVDPSKPIDPDVETPSNEVDVPVDPDKPFVPDDVPMLEVTKQADIAFAKVGDTITYSVTVTNNGDVALANVPLRDVMTGAAGSIQPIAGSGYTWNADNTAVIASLPAGDSVTVYYSYTVLQADAGRNLRNVAIAAIPGSNPEDPKNPENGIDPEKPIDPDVEVPSNEVVVPIDPPAGSVAADPKIKVYGDADPELTYTVPDLVKPGDIWGDLVRVPGEDVGSYTILQGTVHSDNYDITYIPAIFVVIPAPLVIQADDFTRRINTANPTWTAQYFGFRFDDTPADLGGRLHLTCAAETSSPVGEYAIIPSGHTSDNYTITYIPGTLTIWGSWGIIEVTRPGSDATYGSGTNVNKPFPQTGDAQEVLTETRTYEQLPEKVVPESIEVVKDGVKITLLLENATYTDAPINMDVSESVDLGYSVSLPAAPESKTLTYTDPDTGAISTVTGTLVGIVETEGFAWRAVEYPVTYISADNPALGYMLDDTAVPYTEDAPYCDGLVPEKALAHMGLSEAAWRITGSRWTSELSHEYATNLYKRHGVYTGDMYAARYEAQYAATVEIPAYNATATYSVTLEQSAADDGAPMAEPEGWAAVSPVVVATISCASLSILGAGIWWLFVTAKKRKENNEV